MFKTKNKKIRMFVFVWNRLMARSRQKANSFCSFSTIWKKVEITQAGEFSYIFLGGEISSPVGKRKVRLIFITNLLSLSNRKCVSNVIDLPPGFDVNVILRRV
jgi:hypothetical protein